MKDGVFGVFGVFIFFRCLIFYRLFLRRLKPTMRVIVWFGVLFFVVLLLLRRLKPTLRRPYIDLTLALRGLCFLMEMVG